MATYSSYSTFPSLCNQLSIAAAVTMSLDPPTYLSSLQNNIRARPIPWDGAVRAGTISEDQLTKIRAVDKVRKEQRKTTVEADLEGYKLLFVGGDSKPSVLESAAKRADVVQYVLVLLGDLLEGVLRSFVYPSGEHWDVEANNMLVGVPALAETLSKHPDPYKSFLPLLAQTNNPEDPVPLLASTVITNMVAASPSQAEAALPQLFSYQSTLAKSSDGGLQDIAVLEYSALLRTKKSRMLFWEERKNTVAPLIEILKAAAGVNLNGDSSSTLWSGGAGSIRGGEGTIQGGVGLQLLYHVLLVMWQLSFEGADIGESLAEYAASYELKPPETKTNILQGV